MDYQDIAETISNFSPKKIKQKRVDKQIATMVMTRYQEAKTAKEEIKETWKRNIKLWRGDHWRKGREPWKSDISSNHVQAIVESMIPLMGDRQPVVNYLPQTDDDVEIAKKLTQGAQYIWNKDDMSEKFPSLIRDMLILGTAIMKMRWDSEKTNGLGDITGDIIDPFSFFPDPDATDPSNMQWCIFKTKMPIKQIKRLYGKEVPSDSDYFSDDHSRNTYTNEKRSQHSTTQATVLEYWYLDDDGNTMVALVSNGELLEHKPTPYETNMFPFIFFYDHKLIGEFWGISTVSSLEPLQKALNKIYAMVLDNMIATNNTMIVVDYTAGVKVEKLRNEPGLIIEKQPGGNIDRLPPPPIPSHYQQMIDKLVEEMEEVAGIHDVTQGISNGQTSGAAIQILTENSQTRLRGKLRNVEAGVKKIAEWYLILIRQFYTEPRFIRLLGDNEDFKFLELNGQELRPEIVVPVFDEEGNPVIDEETGEPQMEKEEGLTDFDIQISSGSSMMMNKSAKYQQVFDLYQAGAVDIETLLKHADIGETGEIIKNMIKYGVLKDPNKPQVDISSVLGDLGIKVNMTTNNPDSVLAAIQNAQQQIQQIEEQAGLDLKLQGQGIPKHIQTQIDKQTELMDMPNPPENMPVDIPLE